MNAPPTSKPSFVESIKAAAAALVAAGAQDITTAQLAEIMVGDNAAVEPEVRRTHHAWLHPRKGWRNFARPAGTNRRRRLIHMGALSVPKSHEYRRLHPSGGRFVPACKFR